MTEETTGPMAEGERFELSTLITQGKRLAGARTRPLCDPSIWHSILYHKSLFSSKSFLKRASNKYIAPGFSPHGHACDIIYPYWMSMEVCYGMP